MKPPGTPGASSSAFSEYRDIRITAKLTLCRDYADRYYERCSDCGRLVELNRLHYLDDDLDGYCEDCYNRIIRESGVHTYSYKPEPVFYGDGPRYLGVELEIDGGGGKQSECSQNPERWQRPVGAHLHQARWQLGRWPGDRHAPMTLDFTSSA